MRAQFERTRIKEIKLFFIVKRTPNSIVREAALQIMGVPAVRVLGQEQVWKPEWRIV
jgi:hypothetical protein